MPAAAVAPSGAAAATSRRPKSSSLRSPLASNAPPTTNNHKISPTTSPSSAPAPPLPRPAAKSAERRRLSAPGTPADTAPNARRAATGATTRSVSVAFQGRSFSFRTAGALSPERRRTPPSPRVSEQSENRKPLAADARAQLHRPWPAAKPPGGPAGTQKSSSSAVGSDSDGAIRASFDSAVSAKGNLLSPLRFGGDSSGGRCLSPDTGSLVSALSQGLRHSGQLSGFSIRSRLLYSPLSSPIKSRLLDSPLSSPIRRRLLDSPLSSPRPASLPASVRAGSPNRTAASPGKGVGSPLHGRNGMVSSGRPIEQAASPPSIIRFAAEVRRAKNGEKRIEDAHMLRLLDCRHLQWRCVSARMKAKLLLQGRTAEKLLKNVWITTSELRDSVTVRRIKLQLLKQKFKLQFILKKQIKYLDEWSLIETHYSSLFSAAIESLNASTLRLPVVEGAKCDIHDMKEAISLAVDAMQTMGSSISSLLSKVGGTSELLSEIAEIAALEEALLEQSRSLLSTAASLNIILCSLHVHLIQQRKDHNW